MVELEDLDSARMRALNDLAETMEDPAAETLLDIFLAVYETTEGVERTGRLNEIADDLAEVFEAPKPQARIYVHGMARLVEKALARANRLPVALGGGDLPRRRPGLAPAGGDVRVTGHVRRK